MRAFALDRGQEGGSSMNQRRSSTTTHGQGYHHALQLDIERMFSRKIRIYDYENLTLSLEIILNIVMKVLVYHNNNITFKYDFNECNMLYRLR